MSRHELPGTLEELKRVDKKGEPTVEHITYQGVVANTRSGKVTLTCGHHHRYQDMAMTCARRLRQARGWW